jgi:hypothetical protein
MDYYMFCQTIYDLRWETMNVCTVQEIISKNSPELLANPTDNSVNSVGLRVSEIFLFLTRVNFVSTKFSWVSLNFAKFLKM